jgi:hypothetical protein
MDEDPSLEFAALHSELRKLERAYNPSNENLHFPRLESADAEMFSRLLRFAQAGVEEVRKHRAAFLKRGLYVDGMFWYELCLLISSACSTVQRDKIQSTIPKNMVEGLLLALVDMSEFSVATGGDMAQRNHEALGNMLCCFRESRLFDLVRSRAAATGLTEVAAFVRQAVKKVKEGISKEHDLQEI